MKNYRLNYPLYYKSQFIYFLGIEQLARHFESLSLDFICLQSRNLSSEIAAFYILLPHSLFFYIILKLLAVSQKAEFLLSVCIMQTRCTVKELKAI